MTAPVIVRRLAERPAVAQRFVTVPRRSLAAG